jgi:signal transduction histidine kinase/ActR/RegA family two-component response regulator
MDGNHSLVPPSTRHRSLAAQGTRRLLLSLGLVVLVVAAASILIYQRALEKASQDHYAQLGEFYTARLAQIERGWELHTRSMRVLIEYTRHLERAGVGAIALQAFLTMQGSDRQFRHLIVADQAGDPRFQFGPTQALTRFPLDREESDGWYFDAASHRLYRVFAEPIWLGAEGLGQIALLYPVDSALLLDMATPGVTLHVANASRVIVSSEGGIVRAGIGLSEVGAAVGLPWSDEEHAPVQLLVSSRVTPLFSLRELAIGVSSVPLLDALILWFGLGAWLLLQIRRLHELDRAVHAFSVDGVAGPSFRKRIKAALGKRHDEISELAKTMQRMAEAEVHRAEERQREEARSQAMQAALRDADRRKDQFIATLAHELRNPLAPIRTGLDLLNHLGDDKAAVGQVLPMMGRQLTHLLRLVDDLLDVSRVTRDKIELHKEHLDLAKVIESALEMSETGIMRGERRLMVELPSEPLLVEGDRIRLVQVLANLLNNAAKFTAENGHIWVRAERRGEQVQVSVRDDGIGIPSERLAEVFEMFSQVQDGRGGGLGIGLTLVRRLVEMHGGSVSARSDGPGRGAEFIVTLPLKREGLTAEAAPGDDKLGAVAPRRILVVDDNKDIADGLGLLLRIMGVETQVVYGGAAALEALPRFRPDVMLVDIGMPGMDGYEVARQARARQPDGPLTLVAVTGWGADEDRRRVREAGFDQHLVKPVGVSELKAMLSIEPAGAAIVQSGFAANPSVNRLDRVVRGPASAN